MHIAILSGGDGWHVRDLVRAALLLGHTATIVDFRRVESFLGSASLPRERGECDHSPRSRGRLAERSGFAAADAVIVRTMPPGSLEQVVFRMDVLHRLEWSGVRVINSPRALEACVDKYLASARLEKAGLPIPATLVCQDADTAMEAFEQLGGDIVVKPLFGSEGRGIVRVSDPDLAWRTFNTLERLQSVLYLQKFLSHPGWDLRVFVIAGRVLTAMRRHAGRDWRTNVSQGGRAEAVRLTLEEERLALASADAVGTSIAGVDLLPLTAGGHVVLEVNAVPGWRALAPVTGIDVAMEIVKIVG